MKTPSKVLAGLFDAGAAAASTFLAGLIAIRGLEGNVLALYVLLFSATLVAMSLPRQLVFVPSELKANMQPTVVAPAVSRDAFRALPIDALTALLVAVSGASLFGRVSLSSYLALALTAAAFAVISPLQDHLRSALHLVGRHWSAATCSLVVLAVVAAVAIDALLAPPTSGTELLPFGSLFVGKAISLGVGAFLLRGAGRYTTYRPDPFRIRVRFLFAEVAVQAAWFGCNQAVLFSVSAGALGDLEAARVVASPLNIVIVGLLTFLNPSLLRALSAGRTNAAGLRTRLIRIFAVVIAAGAVYFLAIVVSVDLITVVFDRSTDLPLVGARLVAIMFEGLSIVVIQLIFAMGSSRGAFRLSAIAAGVGLLTTIALLPLLGMFALPAGQAFGMLVRLVSALLFVRRDLRRGAARTDDPDPSADELLARRTVEEETAL